MSIRFACPYCQAVTIVSDDFAGHSGPCHTCGRTISVGRSQSLTTKQSEAPNDMQPIAAAARGAWHAFVLAVVAATVLFLMPVAANVGLLFQNRSPAIQQQSLGNVAIWLAIGLAGSGLAALYFFCLLLIAALLAGASADARRSVVQWTSLAGLIGPMFFCSVHLPGTNCEAPGRCRAS